MITARLLIAAGADTSKIPYWTEIGRQRAADARTAPRQHPGSAAVTNDG